MLDCVYMCVRRVGARLCVCEGVGYYCVGVLDCVGRERVIQAIGPN